LVAATGIVSRGVVAGGVVVGRFIGSGAVVIRRRFVVSLSGLVVLGRLLDLRRVAGLVVAGRLGVRLGPIRWCSGVVAVRGRRRLRAMVGVVVAAAGAARGRVAAASTAAGMSAASIMAGRVRYPAH